MHKFVANGLIITLAMAFVIAVFEETLSVEAAGAFYLLDGISIFTFGIWAAVLLYKVKNV